MAYAQRDASGLWLAQVKGLAGCHMQGRTIAQARERVREALALFDDRACDARLVDDVRLPVEIRRLIAAQRSVRSAQEAVHAKLRAINVSSWRTSCASIGWS